MLIKHLYTGRKKSDFILVKDNLKCSGQPLLKKFIEEAIGRGTRVHLIIMEHLHKCSNFLKETDNLVIHRYFPDPWEILNGRESELSFEQIVDCVLSERQIHKELPILLVIQSVSELLTFVSLETLASSLKKLSSTTKQDSPGVQVLSLVHTELLSDESSDYKCLNYLATTLITVTSEKSSSFVHLEYRQTNGKITNEVYRTSLNSDKELQFEMRNDKAGSGTVRKQTEEPIGSQIVSSTFKLTLEEREIESRRQVILPYLKSGVTSPAQEGGRIIYQPDSEDDWDDEDPDDDLEI